MAAWHSATPPVLAPGGGGPTGACWRVGGACAERPKTVGGGGFDLMGTAGGSLAVNSGASLPADDTHTHTQI